LPGDDFTRLTNRCDRERGALRLHDSERFEVLSQLVRLVDVLVGWFVSIWRNLLEGVVIASRETVDPDNLVLVATENRRDG